MAKAFGWNCPQTDLRVRTEIESSRGRAAENQLFAYDLILPAGFAWHAKIELPDDLSDTDVREVEGQLRGILAAGLRGIGKTKARADVDICSESPNPVFETSNAPLDGDLYVLTLQSPALLCDPFDIRRASSQEVLENAYKRIWEDDNRVSNGAFELVRYFAKQSLAGGYLTHRFQIGRPYNPFLLTEPGSVFVLRAKELDKAAERVEHFIRWGLPLPEWAVVRYGNHWKTCPFRPEDGFGEVVVNQRCQLEL